MEKFAEMKAEEILKELESGSTGLTEEKAKNRLEKYGFNELEEMKTLSQQCSETLNTSKGESDTREASEGVNSLQSSPDKDVQGSNQKAIK